MDNYSNFLFEYGQVKVFGNSHWQHPWYARNVLCHDGRRRTAYANEDASVYRVKIGTRWYTGFLSYETEGDSGLYSDIIDVKFIPFDKQKWGNASE